MEFAGGIKEIACGISGGSLKTKWNLQGWPRKNVEFPAGAFVFGLGTNWDLTVNTILWNIQELSFALSGVSRGKLKK